MYRIGILCENLSLKVCILRDGSFLQSEQIQYLSHTCPFDGKNWWIMTGIWYVTYCINTNHKHNNKPCVNYRTSIYSWVQTLACRTEAALEHLWLASDECQKFLMIHCWYRLLLHRDVELSLSHYEKNIGCWCLRTGCWERYLGLADRKEQQVGENCIL